MVTSESDRAIFIENADGKIEVDLDVFTEAMIKLRNGSLSWGGFLEYGEILREILYACLTNNKDPIILEFVSKLFDDEKGLIYAAKIDLQIGIIHCTWYKALNPTEDAANPETNQPLRWAKLLKKDLWVDKPAGSNPRLEDYLRRALELGNSDELICEIATKISKHNWGQLEKKVVDAAHAIAHLELLFVIYDTKDINILKTNLRAAAKDSVIEIIEKNAAVDPELDLVEEYPAGAFAGAAGGGYAEAEAVDILLAGQESTDVEQ